MARDFRLHARVGDGHLSRGDADGGWWRGAGLAVRQHFLCFWPLDANVIGQHWASIRQP